MGFRTIFLGIALDKPGVGGDSVVFRRVIGGPQTVMDSAVQRSVGQECHGQCHHT